MVITALAAEVAGSDDPAQVAANINGVTRDGTECTTFEECKQLVADGEDIDYNGPSGPQEFSQPGEPTAATFAVHVLRRRQPRSTTACNRIPAKRRSR